jgi:quinol monooxygenase YgiN
MIFIAVKFTVRPEYSDEWIDLVSSFTDATRGEPGNLWFDWSRSVENPDEFVLLEAFEDGDAAGHHVNSAHFKAATELLPTLLVKTPDIINVQVPGSAWSKLAEISVPE